MFSLLVATLAAASGPGIGASLAMLGAGLGIGIAASSSMVTAQASVSPRQRGTVTSLVHSSRALGGALFVALVWFGLGGRVGRTSS